MAASEIFNIVLGILTVVSSFASYYFYIRGVVAKSAAEAVDKAEQDGKTGEEKLTLAVEQLYALVPLLLKGIITKDFVAALVQAAFDKIEAYAKKQIAKKVSVPINPPATAPSSETPSPQPKVPPVVSQPPTVPPIIPRPPSAPPPDASKPKV